MAQAVGGPLSRPASSWQRPAAWLLAGGLLGLAVVPPLAATAQDLGQAGLAGLALLAQARPWMLLARSMAIAGAVTALTLLAGVPLGLGFARARLPLRGPLFAAHAIGMFLPPFLPALGWFHVFGREGFLGSEMCARLLFSELGVILVLAGCFTPVVTTLTALAVAAIDPALEEAGRIVSSPLRVAIRILVPAALPALALAALVVFTLALSELGVPMFLRVDVYPAAVFARLGGLAFAPGEAAALALPLVLVALVLVALERRLVGARSFAVLGLGRAPRPPLFAGRAAAGLTCACAVMALAGVAPLAALAVRAASGTVMAEIASWASATLRNSILVGAISATAATLVALVIGHALARRERLARVVDGAAVFAFVMPAAMLGIGMISAWNRPATQWVYGTAVILVLGFTGRYAVIGVRAFAAAVAQSPVSLEEAARVAGARYLRRLVHLIAAGHAPALIAAWLLVFVFCLRDLETAVLFYPPGGEPLTVRIFTLEANGPPAVLAGLAVLHVLLTTVVLAAGWLGLRRSLA
jgi:iron(III) transport system permease protein